MFKNIIETRTLSTTDANLNTTKPNPLDLFVSISVFNVQFSTSPYLQK